MTYVPLRFQATCVFCGGELSTEHPDTFTLQQGWGELNRDSGGLHSLARRESVNPPQFAHRDCVHRKQPPTGSLFDT
jgi:hypothetical protein